jgi:hypothetical protein
MLREPPQTIAVQWTLVRFYIGRIRCLTDHDALMEGPPIDLIGRLQIGRLQAVVLLQSFDYRAHVVANLHDVMVRQRH